MSGISIDVLRNKNAGQDAWVVAGGPSAGYVDDAFFDGKLVIGVNYAWVRFGCDYVVVKEGYALKEAVEAGQNVVASRFHCGDLGCFENQADGEFYVFDHEQNGCTAVDLDVIGAEGMLVVSYSSITSAMHLAAYMGAANILLLGHDCGSIDGQFKFMGYPSPDFQKVNPGFYQSFLRDIEPQTLAVRDRLMAVYGCRVHSLNPWVNVGMEGHIWSR